MTNVKNAGVIRRSLAMFIDLILGVSIILSILFAPGVIIPLDESLGYLMIAMIGLQSVFWWYFISGYVRFENTYGRYVTSVKVVDYETKSKPTYKQAIQRAMTLGLWPIEVFMVGFSKTKRRLGDQWAGTEVNIIKPETPFLKRVIPGVLILAILYYSMKIVLPIITDNMIVTKSAVSFVKREFGLNEVPSPKSVEIENSRGYVTFKLVDGKNVKVNMQNNGNKWILGNIDSIREEDLGSGFSIIRGSFEAESSSY